ncbi:mycothiol synthase [Goodfellowiella coeruleoviolacea]|uniref:Mycothiol acetyltransferase n=1 Tax=Goodfellowiella coeruleoviolacea TaxID=334858 RepID=A0AAE3KH48_9PSEU|nr:mycothiol synthase [Goodfellowiella coeruleoviolacea]MCP2166099.1 mycothiol synthase [Goodfellowiella coeruleoviolacea]
MSELTWYDELPAADRAAVVDLLSETERADGVAPVGEQGLIRLRTGAADAAHLLAVHQGRLAAYAQLDRAGDSAGRQVAELAVRPDLRRQGIGAALVTALTERAGARPAQPGAGENGDTLRVWAHGDHPGAAGLARRFGFRRVRELRRMRRDLVGDLPGARLPEGVRLRAFVPGQDEAAVVAVNHRAFSWHPEQGAMSEADLRERQRETWFDPAGFLLAVDEQDRLRGFHWTKVHPAPAGTAGDGAMGEVYVVGVDPDAQGGGLGTALTLAGLHHLREQGIRQVMLYVEADNAPAVHVYERMGFTLWDADVQYAL